MDVSALSLVVAFAAGSFFTAILVAIVGRRYSATIAVTAPEVVLPDNLNMIVKQPPPPPLPKGRAELWQEVYEKTFGETGEYGCTRSQMEAAELARTAADAAVDKAFPPAQVQ